MEKEEEQVDMPLTTRERMSIHLIVLLLKVIKPFNWSHELDKALTEFKDEMKNDLKKRST